MINIAMHGSHFCPFSFPAKPESHTDVDIPVETYVMKQCIETDSMQVLACVHEFRMQASLLVTYSVS